MIFLKCEKNSSCMGVRPDIGKHQTNPRKILEAGEKLHICKKSSKQLMTFLRAVEFVEFVFELPQTTRDA